MHYYSFHVSDYIHDTAHLSIYEDLAFRRLLDLYYTSEKPIPNKTQEVSRRIRMSGHSDAVQTVLEEFFMFDIANDCWFHKRCDETISAYQAKAERNRAVGKLGGRPKANPDAIPQETQMVSKDNPNHKPITNNHKPSKERATSVACPDSVSQQVWNDWMTVRKEKKAKTLTETGWSGFVKQVEKAGWSLEQAISHCCLKQWVGFEAAWVAPKQNPADIVRLTVPSKNEPDPALEKIKADEKKAAPIPLEVLAKMAELRRKA